MTPDAERFNGLAAMLGFVAAVGAYVTTGQIIPGFFECQILHTQQLSPAEDKTCFQQKLVLT